MPSVSEVSGSGRSSSARVSVPTYLMNIIWSLLQKPGFEGLLDAICQAFSSLHMPIIIIIVVLLSMRVRALLHSLLPASATNGSVGIVEARRI